MQNFLSFIFITLALSLNTIYSQDLNLFILGQTEKDAKVINSSPYTPTYETKNELNFAYKNYLKALQQRGYINIITTKDSTSLSNTYKTISTGIKYEYIKLTLPKNIVLPDNIVTQLFPDTTPTMPIEQSESYLNQILQELDNLGFNFSELAIDNISQEKDTLTGRLKISISEKRSVSGFVVKGYKKFPPNYLKHFSKKYRGKTFSKETVERIDNELKSIPFIQTKKYPEILFSKDSTTVYLYLQKKKSNKFDGFVGLASDETGKATFNGYLDLQLINSFNRGEKASLYWKDNGEEQKTFRAATELPYLFSSPIGIRSHIEIFTEKEQFQNTTFTGDIGYYINFNTKLFLGYESKASTTINTTKTNQEDFDNQFATLSFNFKNFLPKKPSTENYNLDINFGLGKRNSITSTTQQKALVTLEKNIFLHPKHIFNCKTENFVLLSSNYLINELYRFGGLKSIRGFNENTLQANQVHNILTEYRYYFTPKNYIHTIIDYGYANDKTTNSYTRFKSFGLGLGLATKTGLLQFIYANGSTNNQTIDINNSIVHVGYKSSF